MTAISLPPEAVILAIETSCDETAAAVVRSGRDSLGSAISSQVELHALYGGVVPELASRRHVELLDAVVASALEQAGMVLRDVDALAVTAGPGLVGALLCGVSWAKGAASALAKPLIPVHHIAGHIAANYLGQPEWKPPFVCLVVSGGHTHLVRVEEDAFHLLGYTRDDAAGEALDKAARALGLSYPGGPELERLALAGDPRAVAFPRAKVPENEFSFSGLKTALLQTMKKSPDIPRADLAASYQQAVMDVLVKKAIAAARDAHCGALALAGGVAANALLREMMAQEAQRAGLRFSCPPMRWCTDNADMIGSEAFFSARQVCLSDGYLNATASWNLQDARRPLRG